MAHNRGVAYIGPGKVEVQSDRLSQNLRSEKSGKCDHGVILKIVSTNICGSDQHMVRGRTTAPPGLCLGARNHRRSHRSGQRRRVHQSGRPRVGAVQHCVRALPELQRGQDRHLSQRESRAAGRGLRLRGYGRLGRRPSRIRYGAICGLQPVEVSGQGAGDGEDPGSDAALRHFPTGYHGAVTAGVAPESPSM